MKRVLLALVVVSLVSVASAQQFTFHKFGCEGALFTRAWGVANNGVVVGAFKPVGKPQHAMIYSKGVCRPITELDVFDIDFNVAYGVNEAGTIVGTMLRDDGLFHGFIVKDGVAIDVDYPGAYDTELTSVSDNGTVTGYYASDLDTPGLHAFTYRDGAFTSIPNPPGAYEALAMGLNSRGDVVGNWDPDGVSVGHAFLVPKGGELITLDAPDSQPLSTFGWTITERGDILVGYYRSSDGALESGFFTGKQFVKIEAPSPDVTIAAHSMNNQRVVVGSWVGPGEKVAFIATYDKRK